MKFISAAALFTAWFAVFAITKVHAIDCYKCNSNIESEKDCVSLLDRNNETMLYPKPCIEKWMEEHNSERLEPFCRKTVITVYRSYGQHERRTYRGCGWVKDTTGDCYRVANNDHMEYSCQCFEDGCNSALLMNMSKINVAVSFLLGIILSHLCR